MEKEKLKLFKARIKGFNGISYTFVVESTESDAKNDLITAASTAFKSHPAMISCPLPKKTNNKILKNSSIEQVKGTNWAWVI